MAATLRLLLLALVCSYALVFGATSGLAEQAKVQRKAIRFRVQRSSWFGLQQATQPPLGIRAATYARSFVGVLGQEHEQGTSELLVQRREHERQRRLGHTRARRERRGEGGQLLAGAQALDERIERRTVQNERPERPFRGTPWYAYPFSRRLAPT